MLANFLYLAPISGVAALVMADAAFRFDHANRKIRKTLQQSPCCRKAHDASADHGNTNMLGHWGAPLFQTPIVRKSFFAGRSASFPP